MPERHLYECAKNKKQVYPDFFLNHITNEKYIIFPFALYPLLTIFATDEYNFL
jgi:hypothetical protein